MNTRAISASCAALLVFVLVAGCGGKKSAKGFRLPDGKVDAGQVTFTNLSCHTCHTVSGVELPPPPPGRGTAVNLGGEVRKIKTYGQLVTAIINPSHELAKRYEKDLVSTDGKSKMTNYNQVMTVQQLIDLVAFLQSTYEIKVDEQDYYPYGP